MLSPDIRAGAEAQAGSALERGLVRPSLACPVARKPPRLCHLTFLGASRRSRRPPLLAGDTITTPRWLPTAGSKSKASPRLPGSLTLPSLLPTHLPFSLPPSPPPSFPPSLPPCLYSPHPPTLSRMRRDVWVDSEPERTRRGSARGGFPGSSANGLLAAADTGRQSRLNSPAKPANSPAKPAKRPARA